jgi:hypothetical protein
MNPQLVKHRGVTSLKKARQSLVEKRRTTMEDLWKKTEDLECDVCSGLNDRCCGEIVAHYPQYVYRILGLLEDFQMPDDDLLRLAKLIDERSLSLEVGHWTSCYLCGMLRIALKDYDIYHERVQDRSTLKIWHYLDEGYERGELVYGTSWTSLSFRPARGSEAWRYMFES